MEQHKELRHRRSVRRRKGRTIALVRCGDHTHQIGLIRSRVVPVDYPPDELRRDRDNSRAIGVFGFQASGQRLYAPVFFLGGHRM